MKKATDQALKANGIIDPYFDYHTTFADGCRSDDGSKCATKYPNLIPCSALWYSCNSKRAAVQKLIGAEENLSDYTFKSDKPATDGPCPQFGNTRTGGIQMYIQEMGTPW